MSAVKKILTFIFRLKLSVVFPFQFFYSFCFISWPYFCISIGSSLPCLHMYHICYFHMVVLYLHILRDFLKLIFHKTDQFSAISIFLSLPHSAMAENIFFIAMKLLFISMFSYSLIFYFLLYRNYYF